MSIGYAIRRLAVPYACQVCGQPATQELFNLYFVSVGWFCGDCGYRQLRIFERDEWHTYRTE